MILRARILLPLSQPGIENGSLTVAGDRITAVNRWDPALAGAGEPVVDLGEVALLPGWVNAHCHLDYTAMAGQLTPPKSFADWIKAITSLKSTWSDTDYRDSWLAGARMLVRSGTTTVADIEARPTVLAEVAHQSPLRVLSFLELIGLRAAPAPAELLQQVLGEAGPEWVGRGRLGLSPHAPYSTTPDLLRYSAQAARGKHWRLTTHVAESAEEFEMFMYARGPLFEWLRHQRASDDCGHGSPVQHLERCGLLGADLLAVHANYLWHEDAQVLARSQTSVAHCPRSHAFFGHQGFRHTTLRAAGVNLCLGTDSLATVRPERDQSLALNMFAELRTFAAGTAIVDPETMVRMATIQGARALGLAGQVGELMPSAWADVIAVPYGGSVAEAYEGVIHHQGDVAASMIGGQWALAPRNSGPISET